MVREFVDEAAAVEAEAAVEDVVAGPEELAEEAAEAAGGTREAAAIATVFPMAWSIIAMKNIVRAYARAQSCLPRFEVLTL